MRVLRAVISMLALAAVAATPVHSQTVARRPPGLQADPPLQGEYAMEVETRGRWMHERQLPRATEFAFHRSWIFVDSLRDSPNGRRIHLTVGRSRFGHDSALIVTDAGGRVRHVEVGVGRFVRDGTGFAGDSAYWLSQQRGSADGGLALAETRVWDVASTFPTGVARVGLRWTDTLERVATSGPFRQSLRGTRTSRIAGDTLVDGRHLWIVRDSARVQYVELQIEEERTLATTVEVSRVASGLVTGVQLYDPQLRLFRDREDTTRLAGIAVLRYPDGRSFRTPARYERERRWRLYDAVGYASRLATLRNGGRDFGGMVIVPGNELERRLASDDVAARDSIIQAWQRIADPDSAAQLFGLYAMWVHDEQAVARFDSIRIASGDSAYLYDLLSRRAYTTEGPLTAQDVRAMLRFMDNPSAAWSLNVSRDWLYENLVQLLTTWPRAVQGSPYGRTPACTIEACRLLEAQWRTAREPRLRDVGLVALMTGDPRRWADTLLALDSAQHPLLRPAFLLAQGVGATWEAASKAPLPQPNSDWRAWLEWMNGPNRSSAASAATRAAPWVRFEESHWTALRFYEARTGRDVVTELRQGYDAASSDSARLVFGTMLQDLGEGRLTESEVAEAFASGAPARITLARQAMLAGFSPAASAPMTAAAAAPLIDRLLASLVDSAPLWRSGAADLRVSSRNSRPVLHAQPGRIYLNGDSLSEAVRVKWQDRIQIISSAEWNSRDVRAAGVFYTIPTPRAWGRYVRIELHDSERNARSEGQSPAQNAGAITYYLMQLNGEWVIVAEEAWVT